MSRMLNISSTGDFRLFRRGIETKGKSLRVETKLSLSLAGQTFTHTEMDEKHKKKNKSGAHKSLRKWFGLFIPFPFFFFSVSITILFLFLGDRFVGFYHTKVHRELEMAVRNKKRALSPVSSLVWWRLIFRLTQGFFDFMEDPVCLTLHAELQLVLEKSHVDGITKSSSYKLKTLIFSFCSSLQNGFTFLQFRTFFCQNNVRDGCFHVLNFFSSSFSLQSHSRCELFGEHCFHVCCV